MTLSEYERRALEQIAERKEKAVSRSPRTIVPAQVRDRAGQLSSRAGRLPGADAVGAAYAKTLSGASKAVAKTANGTLSEGRVIRSYQRRGAQVSALEDISGLDLRLVDRARPKRMDLAYAAIAAAEGAVAGAVITGGELLAAGGSVASAGAAAAPGMGTVATAMATDAAVVLAMAQRVVSHTAMYYGYDPLDPREAAFALSVVNLGSAVTAGGKLAAYRELSQLTQLLARRATWEQLNKHVLPRIAQQFAVRFGGRLTQRKLGQLVPVVGIGVGAFMNFALLDEIAEAAHWSYRERFLHDKQGDEGLSPVVPQAPDVVEIEPGEGVPEHEIDLLQIIADETREPDVKPDDGS